MTLPPLQSIKAFEGLVSGLSGLRVSFGGTTLGPSTKTQRLIKVSSRMFRLRGW